MKEGAKCLGRAGNLGTQENTGIFFFTKAVCCPGGEGGFPYKKDRDACHTF